jgi:alcohol dehydrogenase
MVFTGPGVVEMLDVDSPQAAPGEVLVEVAACGICGSELHGISKPGFREPPLVMGHEFSGTTPDGRRVTVNPVVSCGTCDLCVAGHEQLCRSRAIIGIHRPGAFTSQVAVPESAVHELPAGLSWEQAALIEPLANAVHAWALGGATEGARVGVIGAGTIGIVTQIVAQHHGAQVEVVDLSAQRLTTAERLGAARVASELTGEYDVIFDAVGAEATHAASLDHLKPAGTAIWIGLLSATSGFDAQAVVRQEKTVRGSFAYRPHEFAEAVQLAPKVDLSWATTYPLQDGPGIFTELMNGRDDVVKAVLVP